MSAARAVKHGKRDVSDREFFPKQSGNIPETPCNIVTRIERYTVSLRSSVDPPTPPDIDGLIRQISSPKALAQAREDEADPAKITQRQSPKGNRSGRNSRLASSWGMVMRWGSAYALFACVACSISGPALAQNTTGGGTPPAAATPAPDNKLPPVEVIQKQAQPAPKAIQQQAPPKKKIVQPAPQPAPAPQQPAAVAVPGTGGIDTAPSTVAGAGQCDPNQQVSGRCRSGLGQRHRSAKLPSAPELLQQTVPSRSSATRRATSISAICSTAASRLRPSTARRRASPSIRTACASTRASATSSTGTSCPKRDRGHHDRGCQPGLRSQRHRRRGDDRDARRLRLPGRRGGRRYGSSATSKPVAAGCSVAATGVPIIAGEDIKDDGFRDFSEAKIRRMYADLGVKGDDNEFHLNFTGADNFRSV